MAQLGADVEQLDALAQTLHREADRIEHARSRLTAALRAVTWNGPDADRFRARWHSTEARRLAEVVAALHDRAQHVKAQAAEQHRASSGDGDGGPADDGRARIVTFNIGRGAGDLPGQLDDGADEPGATFAELDEVAAEIAATGADVVSLQEVHRDDLPRLVEILEAEHGLIYDYEFQEALPGNDPRLADHPDATRRNPYGIAVLSLEPIVHTDGGPLPDDGREPRAFQVEQTSIEGTEVSVVNTHIGLVDGRGLDGAIENRFPGFADTRQDAQTEALFGVATEQDGPVIVTGDFNQHPNELAHNAQSFGLDGRVDVANDKDAATSTSGATIDYILVSPDIEPVATDVRPEGVSDHYAVVVDVDLPA